MSFCNKILESSENDPLFLHKILWTDEASFDRTGINNMHNWHMWAEINPHTTRQSKFQYRFGITVWAGVIDHYFIGPYIFETSVTADVYFNFLDEELPGLLEDVPLNLRRNMIYQHDGATPHSTQRVRNWLNQKFTEQWIGRGGPIQWPARSPDLTPMDYFIWGYLKEKVYAEEISSKEQLRSRLQIACQELREHLSTIDIPRSIRRRCLICVAENGSHIEHLM